MGSNKGHCCCPQTGSTSDISTSSIRGYPVIVKLTYTVSAIHGLLGFMSIVLGILSSLRAEVWMAHRVSPIWSGVFYLLAGSVGITAARKRTAYLVMCLGALCVVSMVVGVVCIQLLKLGLVTHLSDGATYRQDELELNVVLAMATSGLEILICILTIPICCQMAAKVKEEVHMQRDGTFSIQVLGDKEIVIHQSDGASYERLYEDDTVSDLAKLAMRGECSDLLMATMAIGATPDKTPKQKPNSSTIVDQAFEKKTDIPSKEETTESHQEEISVPQTGITHSSHQSKESPSTYDDIEQISGLV